MIDLGKVVFVSTLTKRTTRSTAQAQPQSTSPTKNMLTIIQPNTPNKHIQITGAVQPPGLVGNSQLTILPNYIPPINCSMLRDELLRSNLFRQYTRGDTWEEPRLHVLFHASATSDDMQTTGIGYVYKDVQMKAHPMDTIPGLREFSDDLARALSVDQWGLGVECVLYGSGDDRMGFHADDSQGETIIAALVLEDTGNTPRTVTIKPNEEYQSCHNSYRLQLSQGTVYIMNGEMQKYYMHALLKTSKRAIDQRRIILVFRDGKKAETIDNGVVSDVEAKRHRKNPVQWGHIDGVQEGELYPHRYLMKTYAHRVGNKGVNGNMFEGCDAILISRNCPDLGERDGEC